MCIMRDLFKNTSKLLKNVSLLNIGAKFIFLLIALNLITVVGLAFFLVRHVFFLSFILSFPLYLSFFLSFPQWSIVKGHFSLLGRFVPYFT